MIPGFPFINIIHDKWALAQMGDCLLKQDKRKCLRVVHVLFLLLKTEGNRSLFRCVPIITCLRTNSNKRFPSCLSPLFQSESNCEAFHVEISFIHTHILVNLHVNKTNFYMKGFALGLALKQR